MTPREKNKRILVAAGIAILVVLLVWFAFPVVFFAFLPFIIAAIIAKIIDPAVNFLNKKAHLPRRIASLFLVLLSTSLLGWGLVSLADKLWEEITSLIENRDRITAVMAQLFENIQSFAKERFGFDFGKYVKESIDFDKISQQINSKIGSAIMPVLYSTVSVAKAVPSAVVFTVALVLGTYFISSDEQFYDRFFAILPKRVRDYVGGFKNEMGFALTGYIKAQLTLMFITFLELLIGFFIIGGEVADYAFLLALVICVLDALPIFGTGTVLIPWSVYSLLTGDIRLGVSTIILYGVCFVVRQILEPRIVGERIGVHPLITLMAIYVGLKFGGVLGMFIGIFIVIFVKYLMQSGILADLWSFITTGHIRRKDNTCEEAD